MERDQTKDMLSLAAYVIEGLKVSCMPADIYVQGQELSREEILTVIGYPNGCSQEALDYAERLIQDLPRSLSHYLRSIR